MNPLIPQLFIAKFLEGGEGDLLSMLDKIFIYKCLFQKFTKYNQTIAWLYLVITDFKFFSQILNFMGSHSKSLIN